jgi:hypothetical protein
MFVDGSGEMTSKHFVYKNISKNETVNFHTCFHLPLSQIAITHSAPAGDFQTKSIPEEELFFKYLRIPSSTPGHPLPLQSKSKHQENMT